MGVPATRELRLPWPGDPSVSSAAKNFEKKASGFRLNQQPASKTAAHGAQTAAEVKEKTADLKELRVQDYVTIHVTGYYSDTKIDARHVMLNSGGFQTVKVRSSDSADAGLDKALGVFRSIVDFRADDVKRETGLSSEDLTRTIVKFYARKEPRPKASGYIIDDKTILNRTMGQLFDFLKSINQITVANVKERMLLLNAVAFKARISEEDADCAADDSEYDPSMPPPASSKPSQSRTRSTPKPRAMGRGLESVPRASGKRKRVNSEFSSDSTPRTSTSECRSKTAGYDPPKHTSATPSHPRYSSGFRLPSARPIEYQTFTITRTTVAFDNHAELSVISHDYDDSDTIQIAKDWQAIRVLGNGPRGGWLGGGGSKLVFRGLYKGIPYALAQIGPLGNIPATSKENAADLLSELKLLALGQYFAETFKVRATAENALGPNLPDIRFNWKGAFIGRLLHVWDLPQPPASSKDDTRVLLHDTFLATPLINPSDGYTEKKFSGADVVGANTSVIGRAVDAFAHHVLDDSQESCILVDLQGFIKDNEVILFDPQAHTKYISL
ncbi:hypothetical protein V8D89_002297 [Ganoderma adspersum]